MREPLQTLRFQAEMEPDKRGVDKSAPTAVSERGRYFAFIALAVPAILMTSCGGDTSEHYQVASPKTIAPAMTASTRALRVAAATDERDRRDVDPYVKRVASALPAPPVDVMLGPLQEGVQPTEKTTKTSSSGAVPIGFSRPIAQTQTAEQLAALLGWSATETGGAKAAIRLTSAQAKAIRVAVDVQNLPLGTRFRFYPGGGDKAYEVSELTLLGNVQRNHDGGATGDAVRLFWSPALQGEVVTLEIEVADKADVSLLKIAIPRLIHALAEPGTLSSSITAKSLGACTLDVTCTQGLENIGKSDAMIEFVGSDANLYACSGTLLNDGSSSGTPYFLTANHCVSDQASASSISVYWNYRSSGCNSGAVGPNFSRTEGGATLLYSSAQTDTSFLRLHASPPAGAIFAGFDARALVSGDRTYGVSHPSGGFQKYVRGVVAGYTSCKDNQCTWASGQPGADDQSFYRVDSTEGAEQLGSSGSAVYKTVEGKDYLFGQLMATTGSCEKPGASVYGRFDKAYTAALHQWLSPAPGNSPRNPVYRLYNNSTREHFYTADPTERDALSQPGAAFNYEGIAFYVRDAGEGAGSVYRFYNQSTRRHLYTADIDERTALNTGSAAYLEDGVAWMATRTALPDTVPMFRFYDVKSNSHFYTANAVERDAVMASQESYRYEGVAYYVWATP